jgi:hypothetical protein
VLEASHQPIFFAYSTRCGDEFFPEQQPEKSVFPAGRADAV